jgi:hypothetical protein
MTTTTTRSTLVIATALTVAVIGAAYAIGRGGVFSASRTPGGAPETVNTTIPAMKFGDQLSPAAMGAINAAIGRGWRKAIVVVISRRIQDLHAQTAYLRVLQDRYRGDGLLTVCLAPSELAQQSQGLCRSMAGGSGIDWAELASGCENLLVLDANGHVDFVAPGVPPPDTIRQVAEKVVSGRVDYDPVDAYGLPAFTAGSALPDVTMTRAGSAEVVRLREVAGTGGTIVYFGASCSACSIKGYGPVLVSLLKGRRLANVVVIFATPSDDPQVRDMLGAAGLGAFPVFEIHSVSTAYATRFAAFGGDAGPVIIDVGEGNVVRAVTGTASGGA